MPTRSRCAGPILPEREADRREVRYASAESGRCVQVVVPASSLGNVLCVSTIAFDVGRQLADKLTKHAGRSDVLGRGSSPGRIPVVAVPVGAREICERLGRIADEVVCMSMPNPSTPSVSDRGPRSCIGSDPGESSMSRKQFVASVVSRALIQRRRRGWCLRRLCGDDLAPLRARAQRSRRRSGSTARRLHADV